MPPSPTPRTSRQEQRVLIEKAQAGNGRAKDALVTNHMGWLHKQTRDFMREWRIKPEHKEEVFAAACVGFAEGINRFDMDYDNLLSTFSTHYVWLEMRNQAMTLGPQFNFKSQTHVKHAQRVKKAMKALGVTWGTISPQQSEALCKDLGITKQTLDGIAMVATRQEASLHQPIGDTDGGQLQDVIEDSHTPTPHDISAFLSNREFWLEKLANAMHQLDARKRTILLGRHTGKTLEDLGEEFGITRERVRQIQNKTEKDLRKKLEADPAVKAALRERNLDISSLLESISG